MAELVAEITPILWKDLPSETREDLTGKLHGLWGAATDEAAFNACAVDKQQTLLLMVSRLRKKRLWQVIKRIDNVYGEGGVGLEFLAWPFIYSTLAARRDFTRIFAKHKECAGGFYEKGRADAVLHFLYVAGKPQKWYVHFDLYSPVHSPVSIFNHVRHECFGKLTPDWRMIQKHLTHKSVHQ